MPSVDDVIEVVLEQSYFDQQVINVHQFVITDVSGAGTLQDVAEEFRDGIIPSIADEQVSALEYVEIRVNNITDGLEFYILPVSIFGTDTGESLPSFNAVSVKLFRPTKLTRNGYRRMAGVNGDFVDENNVNSTYRMAIALAFDFLISDTVCGTPTDTVTIQGAIVGRLANGDYDLTRVQQPSVLQVQELVTTQRSRKVGVGR